MKKILIIIFAFITFPIQAAADWKIIENNCNTIKYKKEVHLKKFASRIGALRKETKHNGINELEKAINKRINKITEKIHKILDTKPKNLCLPILLYSDHNSLKEIYEQLSGTYKYGIPLAFYSVKTKSIYIDISSIHDGTLAHEITHAILNSSDYCPPQKIQEILARYVSSYLWD